ncbi:YdcF family protein [Paenibacillus sp. LHD-117]|uniref:YdcF family protein n=1 Tax=Paenibacillus sp. LHD-117 TaxID=3071412 RepID=UPI0027DEB2D8|nr:YdcF family protein [Paenibacillus sp. LHD-117]MDQ6423529.1 YdcF family protein [Paenibacillus sp. LHD-117]
MGEGLNFVFIKRLLIVAASLFIWFIIHTTFVIIDGLNDELKPVDAAVVLGNKVEANGQPSERLKARLDKSIELYDRGYFTFIIVSGGIGKEGFDEAKVMKAYLMDQGIPEEKIKEDPNGYNSYMTAQNTSKMMDELELDSVMVITQYFHVSRTKLAFRKIMTYAVHSK